MSEPETCPKCSAEFSSRKALLSGGVRVGNNAFSSRGIATRCPNCRHIFPAQQLRLFGVLPPNALRWVVAAILVTCVVILFAQKHG